MNREDCIKEVKKIFREDIKKKLEPLHDIQDSVHISTIDGLEEYVEAIANYSFNKGAESVQIAKEGKE